MKKQKNSKKIRLSRETIALLTTTEDDNKAVRGGCMFNYPKTHGEDC